MVEILKTKIPENQADIQISKAGVAAPNFFSGGPLDFAAHRRKDSKWLEKMKQERRSKFLLFTDLKPVVIAKADNNVNKKEARFRLYTASIDDIHDFIKTEPLTIFLGIDRRNTEKENIKKVTGFMDRVTDVSWFAIDATSLFKHNEDKLKSLHAHAEILQAYPGAMMLGEKQAAIFAQARTLLAWHDRYQYCATCGSSTQVSEAGFKRVCQSKDCRSLQGLYSYIIMITAN